MQNPNSLCTFTLIIAPSSELLFGRTSAFSSNRPGYQSTCTPYNAYPYREIFIRQESINDQTRQRRAPCGLIYPGNKDKLDCKISETPWPDCFSYNAAHLKIVQGALRGVKVSSRRQPKTNFWLAIPSHHHHLKAGSQRRGAEGCH